MNCKGVMKTLIRNGRDRGSKNRFVPREERTRAPDWDRSADHIGASSHNGCTQRPNTWLHPNVSRKVRLFPCTADAVHTWTNPNCAFTRAISMMEVEQT